MGSALGSVLLTASRRVVWLHRRVPADCRNSSHSRYDAALGRRGANGSRFQELQRGCGVAKDDWPRLHFPAGQVGPIFTFRAPGMLVVPGYSNHRLSDLASNEVGLSARLSVPAQVCVIRVRLAAS